MRPSSVLQRTHHIARRIVQFTPVSGKYGTTTALLSFTVYVACPAPAALGCSSFLNFFNAAFRYSSVVVSHSRSQCGPLQTRQSSAGDVVIFVARRAADWGLPLLILVTIYLTVGGLDATGEPPFVVAVAALYLD